MQEFREEKFNIFISTIPPYVVTGTILHHEKKAFVVNIGGGLQPYSTLLHPSGMKADKCRKRTAIDGSDSIPQPLSSFSELFLIVKSHTSDE